MLVTIRVPKETTKMQYIIENPQDGYDTIKTVQMGDIVDVREEQPKVIMDAAAIEAATDALRVMKDE